MAEKNDSRRIREIVAGFDELPESQRPSVNEIVRRLKDDECGVGHSITISPRSIYYHRTEHRLAVARAETNQDTLDKSIAAAKQQAVDLLTRELEEITKTRPGRIRHDRIPVVERIHKALSNMEKTEAKAASRPTSGGKPADEPDRPESTMERIARQAQEVGSAHG